MLYLVLRRDWDWRLEVSCQARSKAYTFSTPVGGHHHLPQMADYRATQKTRRRYDATRRQMQRMQLRADIEKPELSDTKKQ